MNYRSVCGMLVFAAGVLCACSAISGSSRVMNANSSESQITDFSATYQLTHLASGTVLESARVQIASHGMTVHQLLGESGAAIVLNTDADQLWLVDTQRRLFLEVPVTPVASNNDIHGVEAHSVEPRMPDTPDVSGFAPFLQFQPCLFMDGVVVSQAQLQGRHIDVWECSVDGVLVETQWFDTSLSLVVKGVSDDGYVSELRAIRDVSLSTGHFTPPVGFRAVSMHEFMGKPEPIKHYNEKEFAPNARSE